MHRATDPNEGTGVSPFRLFGVTGNYRQEGGNGFLKGFLRVREDDGLARQRKEVSVEESDAVAIVSREDGELHQRWRVAEGRKNVFKRELSNGTGSQPASLPGCGPKGCP